MVMSTGDPKSSLCSLCSQHGAGSGSAGLVGPEDPEWRPPLEAARTAVSVQSRAVTRSIDPTVVVFVNKSK